jgi:hypothetical protein
MRRRSPPAALISVSSLTSIIRKDEYIAIAVDDCRNVNSRQQDAQQLRGHRIINVQHRLSAPLRRGEPIMQMQLYYQLNQEDRKAFTEWLRMVVAFWAVILVAIVAVCTVLALDGSMTPEERIAPYQQQGLFP